MLGNPDVYSDRKVEPLFPVEGGMSELQFIPSTYFPAGTVIGQITTANTNEVQTLDFDATTSGGDFTLQIAGVDGGTYYTAALAYNISNANLKIALDALLAAAGYAGVTVTITNGPCPADTTITFGGTGASWDMPLLVLTGETLTGSGHGLAVAATTAGAHAGLWCAYDDDGTDDGRRVARAITVYSFRTDAMGRVLFGAANTVASNENPYRKTAPAWFKGRFSCADLTGLDANGAADLGRIESGTFSAGVIAIG